VLQPADETRERLQEMKEGGERAPLHRQPPRAHHRLDHRSRGREDGEGQGIGERRP
jgi:hypothetical protein